MAQKPKMRVTRGAHKEKTPVQEQSFLHSMEEQPSSAVPQPREVKEKKPRKPIRPGKVIHAVAKRLNYFTLLLLCAVLFGGIFGVSRVAATLQLKGEENMVLTLGEAFADPGFDAKIFGQNASWNVTTTGSVDTNKPGTYTIQYAWDGNQWSPPQTRTVEVKDITIPKIELKGEKSVVVLTGSSYNEEGYTATDNYDGDLSSQVKVEGSVDTSKEGNYELTYSVTDSSGNQGKVTRYITVAKTSPLTMSIKDFTLDDMFQDVLLPEGEDQGEDYVNETILIGDSITFNAGYFGYYPRENIWAKSSIQPENIHKWTLYIGKQSEEKTAVDAMREYKPKRVIINIGSNSASWMAPDLFTQYYEMLIANMQQASPETEIIISSVYPVARKYDDANKSSSTSNDKVNKINFALAQMCQRLDLKFLNVAEALKDSEGHAKDGLLYDSDGIHPKKETYEIIVKYIRTHTNVGAEQKTEENKENA